MNLGLGLFFFLWGYVKRLYWGFIGLYYILYMGSTESLVSSVLLMYCFEYGAWSSRVDWRLAQAGVRDSRFNSQA